MEANEEMCRCYGTNSDVLCRMCQHWLKEKCDLTNGKKRCPPWGIACKKFINKEAFQNASYFIR
jgi:hypothetical protein